MCMAAIVVQYPRFRQMSSLLKRKGYVQNFREVSQKLRDLFAYIQTDKRKFEQTVGDD